MPVLDELAVVLIAKGVCTSSNLFIGASSQPPNDAGPYLTLIETGGMAPARVMNLNTPNTQKPSVQVFVRAGQIVGTQEAYPAARAMAEAAYGALDGIFNTVLSGIFYLHVRAKQEPTDVGLDATGLRQQVTFNLDIEKDPS